MNNHASEFKDIDFVSKNFATSLDFLIKAFVGDVHKFPPKAMECMISCARDVVASASFLIAVAEHEKGERSNQRVLDKYGTSVLNSGRLAQIKTGLSDLKVRFARATNMFSEEKSHLMHTGKDINAVVQMQIFCVNASELFSRFAELEERIDHVMS